MKYMMLVYLDEQVMTEEEREHCYVESAQLTQQLNSSGQYLDASPARFGTIEIRPVMEIAGLPGN